MIKVLGMTKVLGIFVIIIFSILIISRTKVCGQGVPPEEGSNRCYLEETQLVFF
jgi:hypothetical protein